MNVQQLRALNVYLNYRLKEQECFIWYNIASFVKCTFSRDIGHLKICFILHNFQHILLLVRALNVCLVAIRREQVSVQKLHSCCYPPFPEGQIPSNVKHNPCKPQQPCLRCVSWVCVCEGRAAIREYSAVCVSETHLEGVAYLVIFLLLIISVFEWLFIM